MGKLVCYCFGYSESDIEQDVKEHNGESTILERIKASKQAGTADVMKQIPQGNDALGMSTVSWIRQEKP